MDDGWNEAGFGVGCIGAGELAFRGDWNRMDDGWTVAGVGAVTPGFAGESVESVKF